MSNGLPPSTSRASAPTVNDDLAAGYVVGSVWRDTSTAPDVLYQCADPAAGAALWKEVGKADHAALTSLAWPASGHTGALNSIAAFGPTGAAQAIQGVVDGSVLTVVAGALAFASMALAATTLAQSANKTRDVEYLGSTSLYTPGTGAVTNGGSFI
jgi:hypothetical protein